MHPTLQNFDILGLIFAQVRDTRILARCALVHSSWKGLAQDMLFRERVVLLTHRQMEYPGGRQPYGINILHETLQDFPQVASYFRKLKLDLYPNIKNTDPAPTMDVPFDELLCILFEPGFPHLFELRLHVVRDWAVTSMAIDDRVSARMASTFGTLATLHLINILFPDFDSLQNLLSAIPNLSHLRLDSESWISSSLSQQKVQGPRLTHLTLGPPVIERRLELIDWLISCSCLYDMKQINILALGGSDQVRLGTHRLLDNICTLSRNDLVVYANDWSLCSSVPYLPLPEENNVTHLTIKCIDQKSAPLFVLQCMNLTAPKIRTLRFVLDELSYPDLYHLASLTGTKIRPIPGTHFPHLQSLVFAIIPRNYEHQPWVTQWEDPKDHTFFALNADELRIKFADFFARSIVRFEYGDASSPA